MEYKRGRINKFILFFFAISLVNGIFLHSWVNFFADLTPTALPDLGSGREYPFISSWPSSTSEVVLTFTSPFPGAFPFLSLLSPSAVRKAPGCDLLAMTAYESSSQESPAPPQDASRLRLENQILKQELSLASKPQLYFLLNLSEKVLQVKAKGMVLKEWKIGGLRRWGPHPPLQVLTLGKKSALFAPKRKKIKPGENEEKDTFELEALELKDMPTIFTLNLVEGVKIYVRPKPGNFISHLANFGLFFRWYGWFPLRHLWLRLAKKPFMVMEITLASKDEAKAVYWAMMDGLHGLIYSLPD